MCSKHLQASGAGGTEIEVFLTRYLAVLMCASFEEAIEGLVDTRSLKSKDEAVASFVRSSMDLVFRSLKSSEIGGLLGRFGAEQKRCFQEEMKKDQRAETLFNNIVTSRHHTAHATGSDLTFAELVQFYSEGHVVLDAVKLALERA